MQKSICLTGVVSEDSSKAPRLSSLRDETARLLSGRKWSVTVLIDGKDSEKLAKEYYERYRISIHSTDDLIEESERAELTRGSMSSSQTRSRVFHAALKAVMKESERTFDLIEFADWGGAGFIPIQLKNNSRAYENSRTIVKLHGPSELVAERAGIEWTTWEFLINDYIERYSFENADVQCSVSKSLLKWCRQHGWKVRSDATICPYPLSFAVRSDSSGNGAEPCEIAFLGRPSRTDIDEFIRTLQRVREIDRTIPLRYGVAFVWTEDVRRADAKDEISRRLEPYRCSFHTLSSQEAAIDYVKRKAKLTIFTGESNNPLFMLQLMMSEIPFVTIRCVGAFEILGIDNEIYEIISADRQNLPRTVLTHLAYDKTRVQALLEKTRGLARTFCNPIRTIQWYEERVRSRGRNHPTVSRESSPLVTVIVPTRNASKYLQAALESLTAQSYRKYKIIIKDDSNDSEELVRTRSLAERYGAWMIHRNAAGLSNSLNQALKYVHTKYVMEFDADNVAKPHMIEAFVRAMECRKDIAAISSYNAIFYDEDESRLLDTRHGGTAFIPRSYYLPVGPCIPNLFLHNTQGDATSIYRTSTLKEIGGWPEDDRGAPDWLLWLRLVENGCQMDVIPEVLYYYRVRPDSLSRSARAIDVDLAQISMIQAIIKNQAEVIYTSYPSLHRVMRRLDILEQEARSQRELDDIRHSLGYRVMRFYASRIDRLSPNGTMRGELRKTITAYAQSLMKSDRK